MQVVVHYRNSWRAKQTRVGVCKQEQKHGTRRQLRAESRRADLGRADRDRPETTQDAARARSTGWAVARRARARSALIGTPRLGPHRSRTRERFLGGISRQACKLNRREPATCQLLVSSAYKRLVRCTFFYVSCLPSSLAHPTYLHTSLITFQFVNWPTTTPLPLRTATL